MALQVALSWDEPSELSLGGVRMPGLYTPTVRHWILATLGSGCGHEPGSTFSQGNPWRSQGASGQHITAPTVYPVLLESTSWCKVWECCLRDSNGLLFWGTRGEGSYQHKL